MPTGHIAHLISISLAVAKYLNGWNELTGLNLRWYEKTIMFLHHFCTISPWRKIHVHINVCITMAFRWIPTPPQMPPPPLELKYSRGFLRNTSMNARRKLLALECWLRWAKECYFNYSVKSEVNIPGLS